LQLFWSIATWIGEILLNIAKAAPNGHRYLQVNLLMNIEEITNTTKTIASKGVFQWKVKIARAGHISCNGG
jgi:hypothetical protein